MIRPAVIRATKRQPKGIVDGDTLYLTIDVGFGLTLNDPNPSRLLGINCDEIHGIRATPRGFRARDRVRELLPVGSHIEIETQSGDDRDKYGRILAIIWFTKDGEKTNLNQLLLREDLANLMPLSLHYS